jgi:hypothetical protein
MTWSYSAAEALLVKLSKRAEKLTAWECMLS